MRTLAACAVVLVVSALLVAGSPASAASPADVTRAIEALSLPHGTEIIGAFQVGFSQGRLLPEETLRLVERLAAAGGSPTNEDAILLVIAHALQEDLPVAMLSSKAAEGLARGVPLAVIAQGLALRERLLAEVRDLLYSKRIFRAQEGVPAVSPALPAARFDLLLAHIADSLGDYVEGGGSPWNGDVILAGVASRLTLLKGSVIPAEDVDLVLARIEAGDLTRAMLEALDQPRK